VPVFRDERIRDAIKTLLTLTEEELKHILTSFEEGTLDECIREEKLCLERQRIAERFEACELTHRVIDNGPYVAPAHVRRNEDGSYTFAYPNPYQSYRRYREENLSYGCVKDDHMRVYKWWDVTNLTSLSIYGYDYYEICGRDGNIVYIRERPHVEGDHILRIYKWDTSSNAVLDSLPTIAPLTCCPVYMKSHPYSYGKWTFHILHKRCWAMDYLVICDDMGEEKDRFSIPDGFSVFYSVTDKGILSTIHSTGKKEYDLTELDRIRVSVMEPIMPIEEIRQKVLSFLVLDEGWVYRGGPR
jgi:hypothetical protein